MGVEILTCGTCLNFYGLTEKLAVGGVTNMYVIIFYIKDMWARDVAALTFASFMALIPFMAMMFVIDEAITSASP